MNFRQPVSAYMSTDLVTTTLDTTLSRVARLLDARRISSVPVTGRDGSLVGVISRTDLLHTGRVELGKGRGRQTIVVPDLPVAAAVVHNPLVCAPTTSLRDAAHRMVSARVHRLVVVDGRNPVGVISTRDLIAAVRDARVRLPLAEVMRGPVTTIASAATLAAAVAALDDHLGELVVVHEHWPVGVFTALDALAGRDLPGETPLEDVCDRALLTLPAQLPLHHACAQAAALDVHRVIAIAGRDLVGVAGGLDVARIVAA